MGDLTRYLDTFDVVLVSEGHSVQLAELAPADDVLPTTFIPQVDVDRVLLRDNETTRRMRTLWHEGTSEHEQVNLWRAIYETQPLIYMVPKGRGERAEEMVDGKRVLATKQDNDWTVGVYEGDQLLWRSASNVAETSEEALEMGRINA